MFYEKCHFMRCFIRKSKEKLLIKESLIFMMWFLLADEVDGTGRAKLSERNEWFESTGRWEDCKAMMKKSHGKQLQIL